MLQSRSVACAVALAVPIVSGGQISVSPFANANCLVWPPLQGGTNSCVYRTAFLSENVPEPFIVPWCRAAGRLPFQSLTNRTMNPSLRSCAARYVRRVAGRSSRSCLGLPWASEVCEVKSVSHDGVVTRSQKLH